MLEMFFKHIVWDRTFVSVMQSSCVPNEFNDIFASCLV